jgi:hypothetical protein
VRCQAERRPTIPAYVARGKHSLNRYECRDRRSLPPFSFLLAFLVGRVLPCGDLVEVRRFASIRTWQ